MFGSATTKISPDKILPHKVLTLVVSNQCCDIDGAQHIHSLQGLLPLVVYYYTLYSVMINYFTDRKQFHKLSALKSNVMMLYWERSRILGGFCTLVSVFIGPYSLCPISFDKSPFPKIIAILHRMFLKYYILGGIRIQLSLILRISGIKNV